MKKLFIETTNGSLELEDLTINDIQTYIYENGNGIMRFGDKASVNLDNFISYEFIEYKDGPKRNE